MERGCLMSHCLRVALLGKSRFLLDVVMAGLVYYLDVGRRCGESQNVCSFFFVFPSVFPSSKSRAHLAERCADHCA